MYKRQHLDSRDSDKLIACFSELLYRIARLIPSSESLFATLAPILLVPVTIAVLPFSEIKDIFAIRIFNNFIVLAINLGWYLLVDNRNLI